MSMDNIRNPFSLVHAADFSDQQINDLWVENGNLMQLIIEPSEPRSKLILGGKGSGKTHILRYYSYPVMKLRSTEKSGKELVRDIGFLAVFLRATGMDAARFQSSSQDMVVWQSLFGLYLELQLAELLLDALIDYLGEGGSGARQREFLSAVMSRFTAELDSPVEDLVDFKKWVIEQQLSIDHAVNNSAFSGKLDVRSYFSLGGLSSTMARCITELDEGLKGVRVIYMIDEMENFSVDQQVVINSLIRYAGGACSYRLSGRLYSIATRQTLGGLEENREGAEHKTTYLDEIMRGMKSFPAFAEKFIVRRIGQSFFERPRNGAASIKLKNLFEEVDKGNFYERALARAFGSRSLPEGSARLMEALDSTQSDEAAEISRILCDGLPLVISRLNVLMFCKKWSKKFDSLELASRIRRESEDYLISDNRDQRSGSYATAYNHWSADIFAQICKEGGRTVENPYAGIGTLVKMSSCNPRSLLVLLGHIFSVSSFKGENFLSSGAASIELQTEGVKESSHFMFESDTHFGSNAEYARQAVSRLAALLSTARYSINIPEVSPVAVSFIDSDLTDDARRVLQWCLNYSMIFEVSSGRPGRNDRRKDRKIQLNPILSPLWSLPFSRRGDLYLRPELVNSIFDRALVGSFESIRKSMENSWDRPFSKGRDIAQGSLIG